MDFVVKHIDHESKTVTLGPHEKLCSASRRYRTGLSSFAPLHFSPQSPLSE